MHYLIWLFIINWIYLDIIIAKDEIFHSSVIVQRDHDRSSIKNYENINIQGHRLYNKHKKKILEQHNKLKSQIQRLEYLNTNYSFNGKRFQNRSLNYPNNFLSYTYFDYMKELPLFEYYNYSLSHSNQQIIPMSDLERIGKSSCTFVGASCPMESIEHSLVKKYIHPNDAVLELGARYGTTSCTIAEYLNNSGQLVSVEPDYRVWNLLDHNRIIHHCMFWLLQGVISNKPTTMITSNSLYNTRTISDTTIQTMNNNKNSNYNKPTINDKSNKRFYTFDEIQYITNITFTTILIDCEGCINTLFLRNNNKSFKELVKNIHLIILEADMSKNANDCNKDCIDYEDWIDTFKMIGFEIIHQEQDRIYQTIYHYVFKR